MVFLKDKLGTQSGGRILDVATGGGMFLKVMMDSFADFETAVGIDTAEKNVEGFKATFPSQEAKFVKADASSTGFPNSSFDTVGICNSLHHMSDPRKVLSEMYRILSPGGLFLVCELFKDNQNEKQLSHVMVHEWWARIHTILGIVHNPTYKRQEIIGLLSGFELIGLEYIDYVPPDEDEKPGDEEEQQAFYKMQDDLLARVEDNPEYPKLKQEWAEIKNRIETIGFASCTHLIILGWKP